MEKRKKAVKSNVQTRSLEIRLKPYVPLVLYLFLSLLLYGAYLSPSRNLMGTDWFNGGYANWVFMHDYIKSHGKLALWNIYIFSGMPTIAAFFPEVLTLRFLSTFFLPIQVSHALGFILLITLAGLANFFFLREYLKEDLSALFGGLLYAFSAVLVSTTYAGHLGRLISMALFPLYVGLLKKGIDSGDLKCFLLMGAVVGYSFLNGHPQMTYFGILFLVAFFFFYNFQLSNNLKSKKFYLYAFYSLLGGVLAFLIYSFYLLPVYENLPYTARGAERGYEYAVSWSMPPEEIINLITPKFSGILDNYWGRSYFKLHSEYFGIITLLLALIAIVYKFGKDRLVRFLSIYGLFVLLYSFGGYTPLFKVFYYVIPLVKRFRAPNLMFYIFNFISVFLASSVLKDVIKGEADYKRLVRSALYVLGTFLGLFFIFAVFKEGFIGLFSRLLTSAKEISGNVKERIYLLQDAYGSFLASYMLSLVIGALALLSINFMRKGQKVIPPFALLCFLAFLDLYFVDKNFVVDAEKTPGELYGEDAIISVLKNDQDIYRVFPLMYPRVNDGTLMIHKIQSIGGYTSSPPRRYQEFIGAGQSVMFNPQNLLEHPNMLSLLDVRYIIAANFSSLDTTRYDERTRESIRKWMEYLSNFEPAYPLGQLAIYRNTQNLGRVYFAKGYMVKKADEILELIKVLPPDSFRKFVLLEENPVFEANRVDSGEVGTEKIHILKYDANEIQLEVSLPTSGFLVFSENYHPAWKAYVDGKPTKVYLANYAFRAIYCPHGDHKVVMKFESKYHRAGFILTALGFAISLLMLGLVMVKR